MVDEPARHVSLCVYAEGSLKENGNKTKHRRDLNECLFSARYSEPALKGRGAQKPSMLLPVPCACERVCVCVHMCVLIGLCCQ